MASARIHLDVPGQQPPRRSSFDLNAISIMLSPTKKKLDISISNPSPSSLDVPRTVRLSSLSTSYAQFLKHRDMDKNKKVVS